MKTGDLLIAKYNPHHDARGRFTTRDSATFTSIKIKRAGGGETFHDVGAKFREAYKAEKAKIQQTAQTRTALFPIHDGPDLGVPVMHRGNVVVFEKKGKFERIDESSPSIHGSHLLGHEGRKGQHYHYRAATPQEKQELEAGTIVQRLPAEHKAKIKETPEETQAALDNYAKQTAQKNAARERARKKAKAEKYQVLNAARAEASTKHRQETKAQGFKALKGTAKQKQWAETIRAEKIRGLSEEHLKQIQNGPDFLQHSKYWIENRHLSGKDIADIARLRA